MARVYNFSAGPAVLPEEVLRQAADEMLDYRGCGMSVMEMSHRSKPFASIIETAESDIRDLMGIPDNYRVLFLQGGASTQFAMIPMNLMLGGVADYVVSGSWSKKAWKEAKLFGDARVIANSEDVNFSAVPDMEGLQVSPDADYVYICQNETITGTRFRKLPDTAGKPLVADVSSCFLSEPVNVADYGIIYGGVQKNVGPAGVTIVIIRDTAGKPLVADVSSCFLSEPVNVADYGIIYGGVQKNVGPAGVTIVIIRDDLIKEEVLPATPTMLRYKTHADAKSLYNTPPCYGIYMCGKVFAWLKGLGGLDAMKARNEEKAALLYDFLDASDLFKGTARKEDRSIMNVPFVTGDADLDAKFVAEAKAAGLENLKGHRSVGGMRASVYNAMPLEGVAALVDFMRKFELENAAK